MFPPSLSTRALDVSSSRSPRNSRRRPLDLFAKVGLQKVLECDAETSNLHIPDNAFRGPLLEVLTREKLALRRRGLGRGLLQPLSGKFGFSALSFSLFPLRARRTPL